jgi:2-keto-4-pentenoate hydratase/2-oxohepta-3-ene-1,7-dioic acid hydratase in catechol pathway
LTLKLLTYQTETGLALGIKTDSGVLDVLAARTALRREQVPASPDEVEALGLEAIAPLQDLAKQAVGRIELFQKEEDLVLGPCVTRPGKIICIGLNYQRHARESNMPVPESPILFSKFGNSIASPGEPIPLATNAVQYDYEAELVAVIGRRAKYVSPAEALTCVMGYCVANDLSARDLQFRTNQWLLGKTPDKFMPIGPYLVTADEVGDPQQLGIRLWLNGELRQNSSTADMIFSVAEIVSYVSQYMTLEPGDLISTGTPEGVILGREQKNWLQSGDEVTVEIDQLGRLVNSMVTE